MLLSKRLQREVVLLPLSPSMCYYATRNRARTNHTMKERGLSVKISYWNNQPEMAPLQPYRLFRLLQEVMSLRSSSIFGPTHHGAGSAGCSSLHAQALQTCSLYGTIDNMSKKGKKIHIYIFVCVYR